MRPYVTCWPGTGPAHVPLASPGPRPGGRVYSVQDACRTLTHVAHPIASCVAYENMMWIIPWVPANEHEPWLNVGFMLGQPRRRWSNSKPILRECVVFVASYINLSCAFVNVSLPLSRVNIALRRFLHNHGNIATERSPKSGPCPTVIAWLQGFFLKHTTISCNV